MTASKLSTTQYVPGDYACISIQDHRWTSWVVDEAIKKFTHSDYCHAVLVTGTDGTIVEATPKLGVHEGHISEYAGMPILYSNTNLTVTQRNAIVDAAYSYVGRDGYGFLDIAYISLYIQGFNWNWLEREVEEETHRTICSQLVAMCGRSAGVKQWMCGKTIPQLVFPSDLASLALK